MTKVSINLCIGKEYFKGMAEYKNLDDIFKKKNTEENNFSFLLSW